MLPRRSLPNMPCLAGLSRSQTPQGTCVFVLCVCLCCVCVHCVVCVCLCVCVFVSSSSSPRRGLSSVSFLSRVSPLWLLLHSVPPHGGARETTFSVSRPPVSLITLHVRGAT